MGIQWAREDPSVIDQLPLIEKVERAPSIWRRVVLGGCNGIAFFGFLFILGYLAGAF